MSDKELPVRGTDEKRVPTENDVVNSAGTEIIGSDPDPVVRQNIANEDASKPGREG